MIILDDVNNRRPLVVLFSHYSLLSNNVANELFIKGYEILIVSTDKDNWTKHSSNNFRITEPDFIWKDVSERVDNIMIYLFSSSEIEDYLKSCELLSQKSGAKLLVITSYSKDKDNFYFFKDNIKNIIADRNIFAGVIFLAEIFERSSIYKEIINSTLSNVLHIDPKEHFFLIKREQAKEQIIIKLLSLSIYGSTASITSLPISSKTFFKNIVKHNSNLKLEYIKRPETYNQHTEEKIILDFDHEEEISNLIGKGKHRLLPTTQWDSLPEIKIKTVNENTLSQSLKSDIPKRTFDGGDHTDQKDNIHKIEVFKKFSRSARVKSKKSKLKKVALLFLFLVLLPYFTFTLSLIVSRFGQVMESRGLVDVASTSYKISKNTSYVAYEHFRYLSHIPILGIPYEKSLNYALLVNRFSNAKINSAKATLGLSEFLENSFRQNSQNLEEASRSIFLEIDGIYNDHGLIRGQINSSSGRAGSLKSFIAGEMLGEKEMNKLSLYRETLKKFPSLFGKAEKKHYALLLADNRVRRPGGGVIEAVALVSFDNGNLVNLVVYDASELDSLLKGIVSPPTIFSEFTEIKDYNLKDALWNPHFPESASEVKWFLEKQLDKQVDGVVVLNLEILGDILEMTGQFKINNETVKGSELSSKLRMGSQDPLKPDDHFKQIFTIALNRIVEMPNQEIVKLLSTMSWGFDNKHILLHIDELTETTNNRVLNNPLIGQECNFKNCFDDFVSVSHLELSRGVAINKQIDIKIFFEEGLLKRELTVYYKNQRGVVDKKSFQSNLIVSVPQNTSFSPVTKKTNEKRLDLEPFMLGHKLFKQAVVGVAIEPEAIKAYGFKWESGYDLDFSEEGQFKLSVIKQPGDESYPVSIIIEQPSDHTMYNVNFDLTNDGTLHYNTQLSEDIDLVFYW